MQTHPVWILAGNKYKTDRTPPAEEGPAPDGAAPTSSGSATNSPHGPVRIRWRPQCTFFNSDIRCGELQRERKFHEIIFFCTERLIKSTAIQFRLMYGRRSFPAIRWDSRTSRPGQTFWAIPSQSNSVPTSAASAGTPQSIFSADHVLVIDLSSTSVLQGYAFHVYFNCANPKPFLIIIPGER